MSDEYQTAALRDPCFRFIRSIYAQLGNPPHQIEQFRRQAADARKKSEALSDRRWRRAYLGWCDYADRQIDKSIRSHAESAERSRRYREDQAKRDARVGDLLASNPPR